MPSPTHDLMICHVVALLLFSFVSLCFGDYTVFPHQDTATNDGKDTHIINPATSPTECQHWCDTSERCTGFDYDTSNDGKHACWFTEGNWKAETRPYRSNVDFYGKSSEASPTTYSPTDIRIILVIVIPICVVFVGAVLAVIVKFKFCPNNKYVPQEASTNTIIKVSENEFPNIDNSLNSDGLFSPASLTQMGYPSISLTPNVRVFRSLPPPPQLQRCVDSGGAYGKPITGFHVERFDAVAVDGGHLSGAWHEVCQFLESQRCDCAREYNESLTHLTAIQKEEKFDVLRHMKEHCFPPYRPVNALYSFYGCGAENVETLLCEGLADRDGSSGKFGQGIYVTTSIEYAVGWFGSGVPEGFSSSWMPSGCYPVIVCVSRISVAYPITYDTDCTARDGKCNYYGSKTFHTGCDAHLAPVLGSGSGNGLFQCCPVVAAQYYEIVHKGKEAVIPVGILWMKPIA
eukprot:PhF_6_TR36061/c0_g1_i7/m.52345